MGEICVVVAGGSAARIYTLEPADIPELQSGPNLVERTTLTAPPAPRTAPPAGARRHRATGSAPQERETVRRFARDIAAAVERTVNRDGLQQVVVCADKRLLGALRPPLDDSLAPRVAVHEVPKDLAKFSSSELHAKLADTGHLPRRRRRIAGA